MSKGWITCYLQKCITTCNAQSASKINHFAGLTILEESPVVWGPNNKSLPLCLSCLKPATGSSGTELCPNKFCPYESTKHQHSPHNTCDPDQAETCEKGQQSNTTPTAHSIAKDHEEGLGSVLNGDKSTPSASKIRKCSKCRFPICSQECKLIPSYVHN